MLGAEVSVSVLCKQDGCIAEKRDPCASPPCKRLKQTSLPLQVINSNLEKSSNKPKAKYNIELDSSNQKNVKECNASHFQSNSNETNAMETENIMGSKIKISHNTDPPSPYASTRSKEELLLEKTSTSHSDIREIESTKNDEKSIPSSPPAVANNSNILKFVQPVTPGSQVNADVLKTPLKNSEGQSQHGVVPPSTSPVPENNEQQPCQTLTPANKPKGRTPGRKLSVEEKLKREEERLRKQKIKEALEQEKLEKKKEKERVKAEKEKERQETKQRKEQERLEQLVVKKQKEQERQEKKEQEEKEKKERLEKREEERKKREEEKKRKEDEKNLRNEEKRKKEEEENLKKQKIQNTFASFFIKKENPSVPKPKEQAKNETKFQPFELKPFMKLATTAPHRPLTRGARVAFLEVLTEQGETSLGQVKQELGKIKDELANERQMKIDELKKKACEVDNNDDDEIMLIDDDLPDGVATATDEEMVAEKRGKMKAKLLQFHDNYRPAYFGTWRKKSSCVGPRTPLEKDMDLINYEVDSDEEWEEEEPGESLSNSEGEDEEDGNRDEENDGENDGFFVPHGYLSDDEGVDGIEDDGTEGNDGENSGPEANHEDRLERQLAKQKVWETEMKRQFKAMKPVAIGCVWSGDIPSILQKLEACRLVSDSIDPCAPTTQEVASSPSPSPATYCNVTMPVPEEAMPALIKLLHGNTVGLHKLMQIFRKTWTLESAKDEKISESNWEEKCPISKRQLERKITTIAKKEKRGVVARARWYVHETVLARYKMNTIPLPSDTSFDIREETSNSQTKTSSFTPNIKQFVHTTNNPRPGMNGTVVHGARRHSASEASEKNFVDASPLVFVE